MVPDIVTNAARQPLHVLIAEDCRADAELLVAALQELGYPLHYDLVDSLAQFEQRLAEAPYELILCDHNLISWTGMDALEALRRSKKDIPFIMVSAVLGDEAAVEYLKRGATDQVLKHRLDRLTFVVARALQEKAYRQEATRFQQEALAAKEEWELTFDAVSEIVLLPDEQCRIQRANRAASAFAKQDSQRLVGRLCYELCGGTNQCPPGCPRERMLQTGQVKRGEIVEPRSQLIFEVTISPLHEPTGSSRDSVCVMRDVTERRRAEEAIRRSQEELRALAGRLISAREEESKRLARELHDAFSQRLAVLSMGLSALEKKLPSSSDSLSQDLQHMAAEIRLLAEDVHQLSRRLHPSIVDDLGLMAALRSECITFSRQHGITTKFLSYDVPDSLPGDVSLGLYRIAQESLWNIAKHALAKAVQMQLRTSGAEIVLAVQDDGKGFDPGEVKGKGRLGLVSMEERARLLNGSFLLRSELGKGTSVEVSIPLNNVSQKTEIPAS